MSGIRKFLSLLLSVALALNVMDMPVIAAGADEALEEGVVTVDRMDSIDGDPAKVMVVGSDGMSHENVAYLSVKTVSRFPENQQRNYETLCDEAAKASEGEIDFSSIEIVKNKDGIPELRCYLPFRSFSGLAVSGPAASQEPKTPASSYDYSNFDRVDYFKDQLSDTQKVFFDASLEAAKREQNSFRTNTYSISSSYDIFVGVSTAVDACPQYYEWMDMCGVTYTFFSIIGDNEYDYGIVCSKSRYYSRALEKKAKKKIKSIVENARKYAEKYYPDEMEYGMVEYFDQWLCKHSYYDFRAMDPSRETKACVYYCHSSYGTLLKGYGVCESYARSMSRLMDEAGIMNLYVLGDAGDEEDVGGHVWNYVLLDNKWYLQDTTWDCPNDSAKDKKKGSNRSYFLVGSDKDSIEGTVHLADGKQYMVMPTSLTFPTLSEHGYGYTEDKTETAYKGAA